MQEQRDRLRTRNAFLRDELRTHRKRISALDAQVARLDVQVKALQAENLRLRAEGDRLRRESDTFRGRVDELRDLRKDDRDRAEELTSDMFRMRTGDAPVGEPSRTGLQYLLVLTYGRSGSTLLQGVLNSQPGVLIRGENGGALPHLFTYHRTALTESLSHRRRIPTDPRNPWFGIENYPPDLSLQRMRALTTDTLLRPLAETRIVGFKEIRWPLDDLSEFLSFVRQLLPGARFVVNTRNLDEVVRSKWWAEDPEARKTLEAMESRLLSAAQELGDAAYHVHYDDYIARPERLAGLFEWWGEDMDIGRIRRTITRRHSY